jgi:methyl-accepting chemotaxis protein
MKIMNKLTVGGKLGVCVTTLLALMCAAGGLSLWSFDTIMEHVHESATLSDDQALFEHREIDHLKWVNELASYVTAGGAKELRLQTDPALCAFGKWYNSEARTELENTMPELKPLLAALAAPHKRLHSSAVRIQAAFAQGAGGSDQAADHATSSADDIFAGETLSSIGEIQARMHEIGDILTKSVATLHARIYSEQNTTSRIII